MNTPPKITFEEVETRRRAFAAALRDFRKAGGRYHNPAPELPAAKLAGCALLPNRLMLLDKVSPGGVMAEIGVDRGDFSAEILARCKPDRLHLFDIDASRLANPGIRAGLNVPNSRLEFHVGDSSTNMRKMPEGHFDMVYVDGDHQYAGVQNDIAAVLPRMKPGGILIFNDYTVWSATSMFHCGVARAVNELCLAHPWKFRYLALQSMMYNDVMLVRDDV